MNALFPATIESLSTRADKTIKIVLGSQEQSPVMMTTLFGLRQTQAMVLISPKQISLEQIEAVENALPDIFDTPDKSPSKRLRNTLFRVEM